MLIVRRGKPTGDAEGWLTGYDRRHLDAGFFADAERALRDEPSVLGNFRVVELEREPLPQQARLFASARVVIGAHGAGLSNAVFCAPGTLVVEIGKAPCGNQPVSRDVPAKLQKFSSSAKSTSIRLIFGRFDRSRRVLEAQPKRTCQNGQIRSH